MKAILIAATAALAFTTPLAAQSFDPDRRIETFTRDDLMLVLDELGASYEENDDRRNIDIKFANTLMADALLMACVDADTETDCYGTSILATFAASEEKSTADILEAINEFNLRQNFGRAYIDPEGTISLRMYIISDGGILMGNYGSQIELFVAAAERFAGYLYD